MTGITDYTEKYSSVVLAVHAAATATEARAIFVAPRACKITGVSITPDAASTGDNTNTTNLNVINKGASGSGTTEIGNLDLVTSTNLTAFDEQAITITATALAAGDVVALQFEKVGTGVLVGPGVIKVTWYPTA